LDAKRQSLSFTNQTPTLLTARRDPNGPEGKKKEKTKKDMIQAIMMNQINIIDASSLLGKCMLS
jgi:hypothetical protein